MALLHESDLAITMDGDLVVDKETNDLALVHRGEAVMQGIYCRVKSSDPEWFMETICANLEDLIGEPNTRETGQRGEEMIRESLMIGGLCDYDELYVQAVPIDKFSVVFYVFFKSPEESEAKGFEIELHLSSGAVVRRAV